MPGSYENPLRSRFPDPFFRELPRQPGVYYFLDPEGEPLYIGKADNLKKRLMSYRLAKPGKVPDHTLEMLELATSIRWELYPTGVDALRRESELLMALRPPFNIAGTDPDPYLVLSVRYGEARSSSDKVRVDFRLSHLEPEGIGYRHYGCFRYRRRVREGYLALLRLFYASGCARENFHFPARLCAAPPYLYSTEIPSVWRRPLDGFLAGERKLLLSRLTEHLLTKPNVPKFLYAPIQRDLVAARRFYESGPAYTRQVLRELGSAGPVSFADMTGYVLNRVKASLPP